MNYISTSNEVKKCDVFSNNQRLYWTMSPYTKQVVLQYVKQKKNCVWVKASFKT
jgi:hypothetical protein